MRLWYFFLSLFLFTYLFFLPASFPSFPSPCLFVVTWKKLIYHRLFAFGSFSIIVSGYLYDGGGGSDWKSDSLEAVLLPRNRKYQLCDPRHSFPNNLFPPLTNRQGQFSSWALLQLCWEVPAGHFWLVHAPFLLVGAQAKYFYYHHAKWI